MKCVCCNADALNKGQDAEREREKVVHIDAWYQSTNSIIVL